MLPLPSSGQCHYTVAFSPDGRWLAAGGSEHAPDVWNLHASHESARRLSGLAGPIVCTRFTPDNWLVVITPSRMRVANPSTGGTITERGTAHQTRADVSPCGELAVMGGNSLSAFSISMTPPRDLWNSVTGDHVADLTLAARGQLINVRPASGGGLLEVRNAIDGQVTRGVLVGLRPHRVACSADGTLAAFLAHGHLSVWNLTTRTPVVERTGERHGGWLSVAFDPRGRRIVTGGIDSTVAVWDAASAGPPLTTFQWGVGPVYAVTFDRDGLRAAAAGHSGAIVWDVDE